MTQEMPLPDGASEEGGNWCFEYDREAAITYAMRFANEDNANPDVQHYYDNGSSNCTVFLSEVMTAGGIPTSYPGGPQQAQADFKARKWNVITASRQYWAATQNALDRAAGTQVWRVAPDMFRFLRNEDCVHYDYSVAPFRGYYTLNEDQLEDIRVLCDYLADEDKNDEVDGINITIGDAIYWDIKWREHFAVIVGWGPSQVKDKTGHHRQILNHKDWFSYRELVPAQLAKTRTDETMVPYIVDYGRTWGDTTNPMPFYLMAIRHGSNGFLNADMTFVQIKNKWCVEPDTYIKPQFDTTPKVDA